MGARSYSPCTRGMLAAITASRVMENAVLTRLCAEKLGLAAPKFILQMPALPRNASGKVLTRELIAIAMGQA